MDCERLRKLIPARLDGELSARESEAIESHLAQCADCRALAATIKKSLHLYRTMGQAEPAVELPPSLAARVAAAAMDRREEKKSRGFGLKPAFAALALIIALAAGFALRSYWLAPPAAPAPKAIGQNAIHLQGEGIGVEIQSDRFVLHTQDRDGAKGIDLKL